MPQVKKKIQQELKIKIKQELKAAYGTGYLVSVRFAENVDLASVSQELVSTLRSLSPGLKVHLPLLMCSLLVSTLRSLSPGLNVEDMQSTICGDFAW